MRGPFHHNRWGGKKLEMRVVFLIIAVGVEKCWKGSILRDIHITPPCETHKNPILVLTAFQLYKKVTFFSFNRVISHLPKFHKHKKNSSETYIREL